MPVTAPTKSRSVPGSKTVNTAPLHTGEAQDNLAAKLLCCGIGSYSLSWCIGQKLSSSMEKGKKQAVFS